MNQVSELFEQHQRNAEDALALCRELLQGNAQSRRELKALLDHHTVVLDAMADSVSTLIDVVQQYQNLYGPLPSLPAAILRIRTNRQTISESHQAWRTSLLEDKETKQ